MSIRHSSLQWFRWIERSSWLVLGISIIITLISWWLTVAGAENIYSFVHLLLLACGLVISLLLAGLVASLQHTRRLAQTLAREMNASLRQNEERWHLALETLGAGVVDWNLDSDQIVYSNYWYRLLGLEKCNATETSQALADCFHPDDLPGLTRRIERLKSGELALSQMEYRLRSRDGCEFWMLGQAQVTQRDEQGRARRLIGVSLNITEQKRLAQRLEESHERLVKISAHVPGVIFQLQLAADGRLSYLFVSDSIAELYGVTPAEMAADANVFMSFVHRKDLQGVSDAFMRSAHTLEPWHHEYRVFQPQGGMRWVLVDARPEKQDNGNIIWYGVSTDISDLKAMQTALRENEARFRSYTRLGADWYWEEDAEFNFTEIAGGMMFEHLRAHSQSLLQLNRRQILERHNPPAVMARYRQILERHESFRDLEFVRLDDRGQRHVVSISGDPRFDEQGRFLGYRGVGSDITERKKAEEEAQLAAMVYQNSSDAMSVSGADGRVITINPAFTRITGYAPEDVVGQHVKLFSLEQPLFASIMEAMNTVGRWQGEIWQQRKNGELYPAAISLNTIFGDDGQPARYVALFSDITTRKQSEELIWRQANFDALTQLSNRSMFQERVAQEIKKAQRSGQRLALLFIDLDRFKEVNDTLGHDTGDHLLLEAARRLVACVRETDAVARLGGDEFTVLLVELDGDEDGLKTVERVATDILDALGQPFQLADEEVYISASIGITFYPQDAADSDGLFRNADQAMYLSKNQGRDRYSFFTPQLQTVAQQRLRLINELRGALVAEQFVVHFQPVVALESGRIVKAEALLRWNHPQRGMVAPGEFIHLLEETGMIHEIGDWVFRQSVDCLLRWRALGYADLQISVNRSPVQFHNDASGLGAWQRHLRSLGLPGQALAIEITEGLLLHTDQDVVDALLSCRDAGIQVAIDDFGTGYSSLAYLNRFDIDYLKIDRSFIAPLGGESGVSGKSIQDDDSGHHDLALVEAIIVMAHKLGLQVVAEGVETSAQHDLLQQLGCDYAQGYLYARALPADEFEALLLQPLR